MTTDPEFHSTNNPGTPVPITDRTDWRALVERLGPAGPLALVAALAPAIGGFVLLGTLNVVGPWLQSHGTLGVVLYVLGFAILSGLAVLPTYAQAILGGWAFGFAIGFPAALTGFAGGALIGYVIARRATGARVTDIIAEKPKWQAIYVALVQGGFWKTLAIVTLIRIPLNSPFAITNLVMAATRVRPLVYIVGTVVGMAPRTAAAVFLAAGLQELVIDGAKRPWMWIASIVITVIIVGIIGYIANRAVARVTSGGTDEAS